MTSIAVVAHEDKTLGGGLPELRRLLGDRGFSDPIWYQVPKSRRAPQFAPKAVDQGADHGEVWFKGRAGCLLLGNMGTLTGGLVAFPDARPDDGKLEVGVVTADGMVQWARVLGRLVTGHADRSPLAHMTSGREIEVKLDRPMVYELDGGPRPARRRLRAKVEPGVVTVCVPDNPGRRATPCLSPKPVALRASTPEPGLSDRRARVLAS